MSVKPHEVKTYVPTSSHGGMVECISGGLWVRVADYAAQAARIDELQEIANGRLGAIEAMENVIASRTAERDKAQTELREANRITEKCMQLIVDLAASEPQTNSGLQLRRRANALLAARTDQQPTGEDNG